LGQSRAEVSAIVSERFFNFLPNFALRFSQKDSEDSITRYRRRDKGINFMEDFWLAERLRKY